MYHNEGQRDRFHWPATNVNILGTSHIPFYQCRSHIPRHQEETHIPCCHNGRHRLSPFELWSMERLWDLRRSFLEKEMYMVAHQTIGIDMTSGLKGLTLCVNIRLRLPTKDVEETYVVLIVLKHLLFVHATKYGVINVSRWYRSSLPWHNALCYWINLPVPLTLCLCLVP